MRRLWFLMMLLLLFIPHLVRAADPGPVIISEVAWAGSSASNADEWFELFNRSETAVDISGWFVEGAGTSGSALVLPVGSVIGAGETFLIANYDAESDKSTLAVAPDWTTTAVALSNSALHLVLRDAEGFLVDQAGSASSTPLAGTSGEAKASMERLLPIGPGNDAESWKTADASIGFDEGAPEMGTPTESPELVEEAEDSTQETEDGGVEMETSTEPDPLITAVRISEIYPAPPTGEKEWIELVNPSTTGQILDGWTLEDGKGASTPLTGLMLPWSRLMVESPKGALNNSGDLVLLRDDRGRTVDGVTYGQWEDGRFPHIEAPKKGWSIIRQELTNEFSITTTPTPGIENVFSDPSPAPETVTEADPAPESPKVQTPLAVVVSNIEPKPTVEPPPPPKVDPPPPKVDPVEIKKTSTSAPKTARRPRYKGRAYVATVAVLPGVYYKTRMYVVVEDQLRELRLTRSPSTEYRMGQKIGFVAQEKTEGAAEFLLANVNSVYSTGRATEINFTRTDSWPEEIGAFSLVGKITEIKGKELRIRISEKEGLVRSPRSLNGTGLEVGDEVSVEGFVAPGDPPTIFMSDPKSLKVTQTASPEPSSREIDSSARLPWPIAMALAAAVAGTGLLAYLRQERIKRVALTQEPIEEE